MKVIVLFIIFGESQTITTALRLPNVASEFAKDMTDEQRVPMDLDGDYGFQLFRSEPSSQKKDRSFSTAFHATLHWLNDSNTTLAAGNAPAMIQIKPQKEGNQFSASFTWHIKQVGSSKENISQWGGVIVPDEILPTSSNSYLFEVPGGLPSAAKTFELSVTLEYMDSDKARNLDYDVNHKTPDLPQPFAWAGSQVEGSGTVDLGAFSGARTNISDVDSSSLPWCIDSPLLALKGGFWKGNEWHSIKCRSIHQLQVTQLFSEAMQRFHTKPGFVWIDLIGDSVMRQILLDLLYFLKSQKQYGEKAKISSCQYHPKKGWDDDAHWLTWGDGESGIFLTFTTWFMMGGRSGKSPVMDIDSLVTGVGEADEIWKGRYGNTFSKAHERFLNCKSFPKQQTSSDARPDLTIFSMGHHSSGTSPTSLQHGIEHLLSLSKEHLWSQQTARGGRPLLTVANEVPPETDAIPSEYQDQRNERTVTRAFVKNNVIAKAMASACESNACTMVDLSQPVLAWGVKDAHRDAVHLKAAAPTNHFRNSLVQIIARVL